MKKLIWTLLAMTLIGCAPKPAAQTAVEQKKDNQAQVKDKQAELDKLQHDLLCLKVASGEPAAMAEMLIRQTVCGTGQ